MASVQLLRSGMVSAAYRGARPFLSSYRSSNFGKVHEIGTIPYACLSHDTFLINFTWCRGWVVGLGTRPDALAWPVGGLHSDQFLSRVETGEKSCVPPKASQHLPGSSRELLEQFSRAVQRTHPSSTGKEHGLRGTLRLLRGQMNYLDHLDRLTAASKNCG